MKTQWIEEQVANIGSEKSFFFNVPTDIGKICYCDTSSLVEKLPTKKNKTINLSIVVVIALLILFAIWIWGSVTTYQILGSLLVLVFTPIIISFLFKSITDYFIGDLGFSIVKWDSTKTKIKTKQTIFFNDIDLCFFGEQDKYKVGNLGKSEYDGTKYTFSIYKKTDESYVKTFDHSGSYKHESKDDPDDLWMFSDYNFVKKVDKIICTKHLEQKIHEFLVLKDSIKNTKLGYGVLKNVTTAGYTMKTIDIKSIEKISLDGNILKIGDRSCDLHNNKVNIHQGWLMVGRDESNDTIYIEISAISHNKALLAILADNLNIYNQ